MQLYFQSEAARQGSGASRSGCGALCSLILPCFLGVLCCLCVAFLLFVISFTQLFLSSLRLLLLMVRAASEVVPPSDRRQFLIFAVGAVAAPIVHVRIHIHRHHVSQKIAHSQEAHVHFSLCALLLLSCARRGSARVCTTSFA